MSGDGFDKFGWLKALQSDHRYTDKERCFGSIICVQFARRDGTGWPVEMDDIAAKMPDGICRRAMKTAFGKFVRDGYLQETGKSKGGRGVKAWRSYDLIKPVQALAHVSETRANSDTNPCKPPTKPVQIPAHKTPPDLREDAPKGTSKGTPEGTGAASATPPPSRCPKHINHPDPPNCRACEQARHAAEAFETQRAEAEKQVRADALARRDACTFCDEFGYLLGPDGTSTNPATKCTRHNQMEAV